MPAVMLIKVDHNSGHYNRTEVYNIRSSLFTKAGLKDALSMIRFNCHYDNNDIAGARGAIDQEAENFIQNDHKTCWSWCNKQQDRTLMITQI